MKEIIKNFIIYLGGIKLNYIFLKLRADHSINYKIFEI